MTEVQKSEHFIAIIEQNKGILYKVANAYCHSETDRKDLLQEITLQLWRSVERYDDTRSSLSTWMYRIALNVAISFYRKERARNSFAGEIGESILHLPDTSGDGAQEANLQLLQQLIHELKDLEKALILLYLEERSYREIADIVGITETNVATKIARIKEKLKQKFSQTKHD